MTGLLSLPNELLQAIGHDLGPTRKHLRLVCVQLSLAMDPLVFSHVVINVTRPRLHTIASQLQFLARTRIHTAQFVRELHIRSLALTHDPPRMGAQMVFSGGRWSSAEEACATTEDQAKEKDMKEYLEDAIANMVNLQVVRWNATPRDPKWTSLAVTNALARTYSLTYLNLHLSFGFDASSLRLDRLHNLKRIVISGSCESFHKYIVKPLGECISHCPEINSIDIDTIQWDNDAAIPTLHDLVRNAPLLRLRHLGLHGWCARFDSISLPHLRFLKSLTLTNNLDHLYGSNPFASVSEGVWSALRVNEIHLERISTDVVDGSLIEYLTSYSGLTRIYLKNITIPDQESSNRLAEVFFDSALTQHSHTLEDLYVLPSYEGKWCFGEHVVATISHCPKLEYAKFVVISSEVNPSKNDDTISLLITATAHHLRCLKNLSISTAKAQSLRGLERTNVSKKHFSFTNDQIAEAIMAYIPPSGCHEFLPIITANSIKYVPQLQIGPEMEGTQPKLRYHKIN